MTAGRGRTGLALIVAAAVAAAGVAGVATAAKAPAKRNLTASGTKLAFSKKTLSAPAGGVQLVLTNKSDLDHDVAIKGKNITTKKGKVVGRNGVSKVTITLKPGKYTYFCSVSGHEAAGMKGTLTVVKP